VAHIKELTRERGEAIARCIPDLNNYPQEFGHRNPNLNMKTPSVKSRRRMIESCTMPLHE
jgi:hypothetical protein